MSEILLAVIALGVLAVAVVLHRISNILLDFLGALNQRQQEITEALWAKMGISREEWREREKQVRMDEQERRYAAKHEIEKP